MILFAKLTVIFLASLEVIFYSRPKRAQRISLGAAEYHCKAIELAAGE